MNKTDSLEIKIFNAQIHTTNDLKKLEDMKLNISAAASLSKDEDRKGILNFKINLIKNRINEILKYNK